MLKVINRLLFNLLNSSLLFYVQLGALVCILFSANSLPHPEYALIIFHLLIGFFAVCLIVHQNFGLLANTMGVFTLVGFCFSPILELLTGTIYWYGSPLSFSSRLMAIICIVLFLIIFIFGYQQKFSVPVFIYKIKVISPLLIRESYLLFLISISLFIFVLSLYGWNFSTLFFRGGEFASDLQVDTKGSYLIVEFFIRPLIYNIGLFLFFFCSKSNMLRILGPLVGFLAAFPTGIPRFMATALYIPFFLNWSFSLSIKYGLKASSLRFFLPNLLLIGLVFAFPFLDVFRFFTSSKQNLFDVFNLSTFLSGHFDAFQMFVRALDVGNINFGSGLLGALLFYVPRNLWPGKPISSAPEIAALSNLSFDNLSMPLIAEFYLNYWYVGIVVGAFLLGLLFGNIDRYFKKPHSRILSIQLLFYFESIGLVLLILRGSFLSAFAYFSSVGLSWIFIDILYTSLHAFKISSKPPCS